MSSPKKNVAYVFYISVNDAANAGSFKANPTIAAGDFQVSTDGSAFANLATLPIVDPSGSIGIKIDLSASEMNGDKIIIQGIDAAGAEWNDVLVFIDATVANIDDIVRSTTPENTLDISATGEAGIDVAALNNISTSDVLTQVNTALDTAIAELGIAAPSDTPSLRNALMLMYMALLNDTKVQTSATDALEIHNATGTIIAKKLLTDDGADYLESKMISG